MSDDSSSTELIRTNGSPRPVEWVACPNKKDFILIFRKGSDKAIKMLYTLKETKPKT